LPFFYLMGGKGRALALHFILLTQYNTTTPIIATHLIGAAFGRPQAIDNRPY